MVYLLLNIFYLFRRIYVKYLDVLFYVFIQFFWDFFTLYFLIYVFWIPHVESFLPRKRNYNVLLHLFNYLNTKQKPAEFFEKILLIFEYEKNALTFYPTLRREMIQYYLYWRRTVFFYWNIYVFYEGSWYERDHPAKFRRHVFEKDVKRLWAWFIDIPRSFVKRKYKLYHALLTNQDARNLYNEKWTSALSGFVKPYRSLRKDIKRSVYITYLLIRSEFGNIKYDESKEKEENREDK